MKRSAPFSLSRRVGLARALSKLGYCSRTQAVELIRAGRVCLNGRSRTNPETPVQLGKDRIEIDSDRVAAKKKIYLMLNKPRGLVTTASDEKGRETIYACLPPDMPWVAPVGRLDRATEGLLIVTNDSEWADAISSPGSHVPKTYHVQIDAVPDEAMIQSLVDGVDVPTLGRLRAKHAEALRHGQRNGWLSIILDEGKNRQIRRMLEALNIRVLRLIRIAIGPLELGELAKGACRALTSSEKAALDRSLTRAERR